jgi:hypothetical protein
MASKMYLTIVTTLDITKNKLKTKHTWDSRYRVILKNCVL